MGSAAELSKGRKASKRLYAVAFYTLVSKRFHDEGEVNKVGFTISLWLITKRLTH